MAEPPATPTDIDRGASTEAPQFVYIGLLSRPHGVRGELRFVPEPSFEWTVLDTISTLYLGEDHQPYPLLSARSGPKALLVKLENIDTRAAADTLRDTNVYLHHSDAPPLGEWEHFVTDLLGSAVYTDAGQHLGELVDVLTTGANDVLVVVNPDGVEILLPHIADVVKSIDVDAAKIIVHLLEGLLPD